ncbi:uncharacterized protein LOC118739896 [Rhagoletis pomonella]|uniref:uncharacterized protein LOC118739896 n=1 Tax=Rhagoletis pomonella TaxID=28610 RepID=UPI00178176AC|nr:uncharacterized protein LOC118739896 [Rhagoletis pomonella]
MDTCSLCKKKYSKLYNPNERVLGTQLSSAINFIIGDEVDFPPKYLICTECSVGLISTEIVVKHLSKCLTTTRNFKKGRSKSGSSHNEQDENNEEEWEDQSKEKADEEVDRPQNQDASKPDDASTFHCTHSELTTKKANLYKFLSLFGNRNRK